MASRKPTDKHGRPLWPQSESIPGEWDERSIEVDLDVVQQRSVESVPADMRQMSQERSLADLWPTARKEKAVAPPDVILFDPMGFKIADTLRARGFAFRTATSGVDVMGLIAASPTGLVLCGPSEDAERRRLLTAAVNVRFPNVPVLYASTHANNPEAVAGAKREGAVAVIPIPFPAGDQFDAFLTAFVTPGAPPPAPRPLAPEPAAHPATLASPATPSTALDFDDRSLPNTIAGQSDETAEHISVDSFDGFEDAKTDAMDVIKLEEIKRDGAEHEASVVRPREKLDGKGRWSFPPAKAPEAQPVDDKESDSLVAAASAIGPFLWGLDDALAWTEQKAREGHHEAVTHARTLSSIRQILKGMAKKKNKSR